MAVLLWRGHRWPHFSWGDNQASITQERHLCSQLQWAPCPPNKAADSTFCPALPRVSQGTDWVTSLGTCPCPRKHSSAGEAGGSLPGRIRHGLRAAAKSLLTKATAFTGVSQLPFHLLPSLCIIPRAALCGDFHYTLCLPIKLCRQTQVRGTRDGQNRRHKDTWIRALPLWDKHREWRIPSVSSLDNIRKRFSVLESRWTKEFQW